MIYAIDIRQDLLAFCVFFSVIPYIYFFFNLVTELHPCEFALGYILFSQHNAKKVFSGHWRLRLQGNSLELHYSKTEYVVVSGEEATIILKIVIL